MKLYGLTDRFAQEATLYDGLYLARVTEQHRELYKVVCEAGELAAKVSGKLAYGAADAADYPVVGDFVMLDRTGAAGGEAVIHQILRRKSLLSRKAAGGSSLPQPIAANIDTIFICMSLNANFNLRRIERYLAIAWDSMATPVIVLTKADLCADLPQKIAQLAAVAPGAPVVACSVQSGEGLADIESHLAPGRTVAFIGSSGVGKSTLINKLAGREVLATAEIREDDDRGRHTTSHRQLLALPGGGVVIDTPGMRELSLYTGDLEKTFEDIDTFAKECRYRDCTHTAEPGCRVRRAVEAGELAPERLDSYRKLRLELSYEGLSSRQLENEKIKRMFGGKGEMKQAMDHAKHKRGK
ncbi:MAG TPA: ribosome small subunit-dependent GTPase A [Terriglobales bacterium]|nr:ribosome small subunit-dependent GTPase A [Terriglobales bacterium]